MFKCQCHNIDVVLKWVDWQALQKLQDKTLIRRTTEIAGQDIAIAGQDNERQSQDRTLTDKKSTLLYLSRNQHVKRQLN